MKTTQKNNMLNADKKFSIYLADLTHTTQIVAANVFPLGIGLLASYALQHINDLVDITLYKYPQDLNNALNNKMPDIIGFSNYSWNCELSYQFVRIIKDASPKTVIVFGGPNYGLTKEEIFDFWSRYSLIDFYIVKEGEIAFLELIKLLIKNNFNIEATKNYLPSSPNCHFFQNGNLIQGEILSRIKDLNILGSPYLMGLMDKFFDNILIPMIHTTRGCPFQCTFCTEGDIYYNEVAQRYELQEELEYIAQHRREIQDLIISDANFGMFQEDIFKGKIISEIQKIYDWPKRIFVSTGKNKKERVIEVASLVNSAIHIAASLQSTDKKILQNIQRTNISLDALHEIAKQSTNIDSQTYTEIILALPGDTVDAHTQSLKVVTDLELGTIRMYQLTLLPQTELNTMVMREKYGIKTKFRINPRSFGKYTILNKEVYAIEYEELCIETNTLTFQEYLDCRELDLTVEILHNTGTFTELMGLCRWLGHSWFDFMYDFHRNRKKHHSDITNLYLNFTLHTKKYFWNSREELMAHVIKNIDTYLSNTLGTNEMASSKAIVFFKLQDILHNILFDQMKSLLSLYNRLDDCMELYLMELKKFSKLRKKDLLATSIQHRHKFHFDFLSIEKQRFAVDPHHYFNGTTSSIYHFFYNKNQEKMINEYILQYGQTVDGLGRILMRAPIKNLFRDINVTQNKSSSSTAESLDN